MNSSISVLDIVLNEIIDELNPNYIPVTDEECVTMEEDHGIYQRVFKHRKGSEFLLKWTVWYGNPDTVKTIFHPVEEL